MPPPSDVDSDEELFGLPSEPEDYYLPSPPASSRTHTLTTAAHEKLTISLVGQNPLWGHYLWNAALVLSRYLETHKSRLIQDRSVLELGAGGGLPSLTCALRGAASVVCTDYPDPSLVRNLQVNADALLKAHGGVVKVEGYLWGADTAPLIAHLPEEKRTEGFDTLLLSDLVFNHSEHAKLVDTVLRTMAKREASRALVFFTPHRPWLLEQDLAFFESAKEKGLIVEKVLEELLEKPMFEEDKGDRELRRTVFGYELRWGGFHSNEADVEV
ncbi:hypothetical protein EX30DRAFT_337613 [Ascodesmis nigricans]|uniref:Protein N-terminal and lysine N-methyltransferase EFM7 n=1 Tax=Ascodesmis nigricans TaxID=341454 RepID=A0A4S2N7I8_9PEZI|nr:hypothetical protein EX30DRAFT_337613 [Ascodesmis nigricans]